MKKALIALDSTPRGRRAAEYAAAVFPAIPDCEVVLLILTTGVPETPEPRKAPELHGDEDHHQELVEAETLTGEVAAKLGELGVAANRVRTLIKPVRRGIAQDIVDHATAEGCDTIVLGRSDTSRVRELLHGSVSAEVLHRVEDQTVWVVA